MKTIWKAFTWALALTVLFLCGHGFEQVLSTGNFSVENLFKIFGLIFISSLALEMKFKQ